MNRLKFAWLILTDNKTRWLLGDTLRFADRKSYESGDGSSDTIWFISRTFKGKEITIT